MHFSAWHGIAAGTAAAFVLAAPALAGDVKAGVDLWNAGNHAGAVAQWRPLAEEGNPDAQFNLGQAYRLGKGVAADQRIAQSWFQKAAQQGHAQAQANLGLMLFQNGNRAAAMPWIRKAAEAGDARAQYVLGTALFNGDIVGKDWPHAYALMMRASAQGLGPAAANLAEMEKIIPLAQRQQGIQLARRMEQGGTAIAAVAPAPQRPAPARPAPQPAAPAARAVQAAPAVRVAGGWKVQLGAFANSAGAQRQWQALSGRVPALRGLQPILQQAGAVVRLQAGPVGDKAGAARVCAAAKAAGAACFPVAP
jgi:cell division septation protein DedD